jgi:TldD protein
MTGFQTTIEDCRKILSAALASGGEFADLYFERRVATGISYEESRVRSVQRGVSQGLGVRVVVGERSGLAYTEDLSLEKMLLAARTASAIARDSTPRATIANVAERSHPEYYPLVRDPASADLREKLAYIEAANAAALSSDARIIRVQLALADELREIFYVNSDGASFTDRQPMLTLRASAIAAEGKELRTGRDSGGGRIGLEYFDRVRGAAEIGREAARLAILLLDAREIEAGPQTVVLGPADSGVLLHEAVGHGLEADFNRKNLSNYSGQIGERVASDLCTIVDAGTFPNMRGSINIDDEGAAASSTTLIEKGVLRGYINDRISAVQMKTAPTGNGRRESFAHLPMPRMTNTYMQAGPHDPEEILRSVKRGVYARKFGGGQVDITKGDFVFSVEEGYLIEDGRLTAPLKGVTLIGNGPDVMRRIDMAGSDLKFTDGGWTCGKNGQSAPVGMGIPTVRVSEITVGGSRTG